MATLKPAKLATILPREDLFHQMKAEILPSQAFPDTGFKLGGFIV